MDEILENEILSKKDLIDYDVERSYYRVCKLIRKYKRLKCKSFGQPQITITTKYKYVFVDEPTRGINDYTQLDKYIDDDTEYKRLSQLIVFATQNMSPEELVYYTLCLYNGKPEYRCIKEIGCSSDGLKPIKKSCIIKFACVFDLEVYKNDKFDDDEEDDYQKFIKDFKL